MGRCGGPALSDGSDSKLISTSQLHPRDRFDYWHEIACRATTPHECRPRNRAAFQGEIHAETLAGGSLTSVSHNGITTWRTRRQIAQANDCVFLCLQLVGSARFSQYGRDVSLSDGDLALVDNGLQANMTSSLNSHKLLLELGRRDCEARLGKIQQSAARRIDGSRGLGKLLSTFVQGLRGQSSQLSSGAQAQISLQVIDLVAVALSEGESAGPVQSSGRLASLLRLKSVVDANLSNSNVTCEDLANAAGISVRYANQLLDAEDTSLRRLLFSRRIAKCQATLADKTQAHRQISDIAYSWGFDDPSHFGRLFKDATGMTPRSYRMQARQP
ncbi:AraC family transcriptional regulator [Hyphomicrobium methylovorum]|nr:AraC family transcriptional regulator [Hyphomicrobium methylovorum]